MEELKQELLELKEKTRVLEEQLEKIKIGEKIGRKRTGEHYYYICEFGSILKSKEEKCPFDDGCYNIGNYFRTEVEAKQALEKMQIYMELKRFAENFNTEEIDWKDYNKQKYYIYYICNEEDLDIENTTVIRDIGQIYFTSRAIAKQAIEFVGEENIRKLFE